MVNNINLAFPNEARKSKNNLEATVSPTVSNDSSEGYSVGSFWSISSLNRLFLCLDSSVSAAGWIELENALLNNYSATTSPTVSNDSTEGYSVGSKWFDITGSEAYVCLDDTEGAANWQNTSLTLDDLGSLATQDSDNVAITGGNVGDATVSEISFLAGVTSALQTQLDSKENVSNKENSTLDTSTSKYPTNNLVKTTTDSISSSLSSHTSNVSNPHAVTASQLSLGNVDNTSDANKPISTATQAALDLKEDVFDYYAASASGSVTIDPENGDVQIFTLTASTTFTLDSAPSSPYSKRIIVEIIQDSTGSWIPTFDNITWDSGVTPNFDTTANSVSTIEFVGTVEGWRGYVAISNNTSLAAKSLYIYQTTNTSSVLVEEGIKTNIAENAFFTKMPPQDLITTGNTLTTLYTLAVPTDRQLLLCVAIVARRTGGSLGANGAAGSYVLTGAVNNASDVVTHNITTQNFLLSTFAGTVAVSTSGANLLIRVTGMISYTVAWVAFVEYHTLSS